MEDDIEKVDALSPGQDVLRLPQILPATLGIATIKEVLRNQTVTSLLRLDAKSKSLDIELYKERLNRIWVYNHTSTAAGFVESMIVDIATISAALDQMSGEDKSAIGGILCCYLQTYGHIMRDQGLYAEAIAALEEALGIAETMNNAQLLAIILLRLGNVYHDRGDISLAQSKIDSAESNTISAKAKRASADVDFQMAMKHFVRVESIKDIAPEINIALLMGKGNVQARMAQGDKHAVLVSLTLLSQTEKIIANNYLKGASGDEYSVFSRSIDVARRQLQISKASALLAADWPREALQELTDMLDLPPRGNMVRMNAYTNLLWARGYADTGKLDGAALLAQDSLAVMKRINSEINIKRIRALYRQLINCDRRQIEVIRLGVMFG